MRGEEGGGKGETRREGILLHVHVPVPLLLPVRVCIFTNMRDVFTGNAGIEFDGNQKKNSSKEMHVHIQNPEQSSTT